MAVELGVAGDELMPGTPHVLFDMPVVQPQRATWYDVSKSARGFRPISFSIGISIWKEER
jgi:hypothetical protein